MNDAIVFQSYQRFRVDGRKRDSHAPCVHAYFFDNGGKNLRFQKYLDVCGQGLNNHTKRTDRD